MPGVPEGERGIVIFGDIVGSRREAGAATAFLRAVAAEVDEIYPPPVRLARTAFTQGDELQALLRPHGDPFEAVVHAALRSDARPIRWAIVAGSVDPGSGPATERTGEAFVRARALLERAKATRDALAVETGDAPTDGVLADIAPLLPRLLDDLTARQREVARLLLVDGLRRAEVADRLSISRATVSVMADRARIRQIGLLARALATMFGAGVQRATAIPGATGARA